MCLFVLGARWRALEQRVPLVPPAAEARDAADLAGIAVDPPADEIQAHGRVDINTARASELEALPGIGPVLAGRIIAWREAHGMFASLRELLQVRGIGEKKLAALDGLAVCSGSLADSRSRE